MPIPVAERVMPTYQLLSTQKCSPRATIIGRPETTARFQAANAVPASSTYQSLRDWSAVANANGPRIGARSIGPANRVPWEPDSMLGNHLRGKNLAVPMYDPPAGMGEYNSRKAAAVMCGSHDRSSAAQLHEVATTPGPLTYVSSNNTMQGLAAASNAMSSRTANCCTFGRRLDERLDNGVPGPGAYDETTMKTLSPVRLDDVPIAHQSARSGSSRGARAKAAMEGSFGAQRGKSLAGRWHDRKPDPSPGPGAYAPVLPFIGSAAARVPTIKGRLTHPFCDTLASHEFAKTDRHNHTQGTPRRHTARVTAK